MATTKSGSVNLRAMRGLARFPGHAPNSATPEELRAFQLDMKERGVGAPTFNNRLTVLSFFYATRCLRPESEGGKENDPVTRFPAERGACVISGQPRRSPWR
ncbi:hypothetical protein ETW24_12915 [Leisingera sp. NJS204]|nr:hypothetical protein ETW24_12915 [Leisingera sp. NJS204]